jgi:ubiquinone/menaquinone biosynthesis C-methylase UbiE
MHLLKITKKAEKLNQELWDEVAPVHFKAYKEVQLLREGGSSLDEIELREMSEVRGKTLLHLQCHIGTDTLSWARQGAVVTGVDFSTQSIAYARQSQQELQLPATFLVCNVYDLPLVLQERFDIVYTSRGVLCWLKDLDQWAQIVAHFLKPSGFFYIMETHPLCNVFEETKPDELAIAYPYFHTPEPTLWDEAQPDYADDKYIPQHPSYEWSWSIGDILNSLIKAGLQIEFFNEYERLFFKRYPGMVEYPERWFQFPQFAGKLPLLFTLKARKPEK